MIFDDSKTHHAENNGKHDRIVLIIDIERPCNVRVGNSKIEFSKEVNDLIVEMIH